MCKNNGMNIIYKTNNLFTLLIKEIMKELLDSFMDCMPSVTYKLEGEFHLHLFHFRRAFIGYDTHHLHCTVECYLVIYSFVRVNSFIHSKGSLKIT
jgi:hypothetical protein